MGKGGMGALLANGKKVAAGRIERTMPILFSFDLTFDVGEDWGTAVADTYELPFGCAGTLERVTVEV